MTKKIWIPVLVCIGILFIAFIAICLCIAAATMPRSATTQMIASGPHFGPDSVRISTEFGGRIWNEQPTIITGGHVVDKNVSWQVRYDGDESKTFTFPPYNTPGNNVFMYTNPWTYREERVMPNPEGKTSCEYAFRREPRQ